MSPPSNTVCIISLVILTVFVSNLRPVYGEEVCTGVSPCKCAFDNGQTIDLSPLGRLDGLPRFNETSGEENRFMWNPCFNFTFNTACQDVALCEIHPSFPKDLVFAIGYQNSARFAPGTEEDDDVQLIYTTKNHTETPVRTAFISLNCTDDDVENTTLEILGEKPIRSNNYYFILRSAVACRQSSSTSPSPTSPSSSSSPNSSTSITPSLSTVNVSTSVSTSGSTRTSVSPSGSTRTSVSSSGSTPTSVSTSGSTPTSLSTSGSTRTSVSSSGSTRTSVSTSGSTATSSIVSTRSTTNPPTTSKPDKSKATVTALVVCAIILVIALAVALTVVVLRKKGKICQKEEYDNL